MNGSKEQKNIKTKQKKNIKKRKPERERQNNAEGLLETHANKQRKKKRTE